MANHKSAIRQWRRSLRRRAINKSNKASMRSEVRQLREAIQSKDRDKAQELLNRTFSDIDKAVKKGAIHQNKGRRYKSRLSRQVESITATPMK